MSISFVLSTVDGAASANGSTEVTVTGDFTCQDAVDAFCNGFGQSVLPFYTTDAGEDSERILVSHETDWELILRKWLDRGAFRRQAQVQSAIRRAAEAAAVEDEPTRAAGMRQLWEFSLLPSNHQFLPDRTIIGVLSSLRDALSAETPKLELATATANCIASLALCGTKLRARLVAHGGVERLMALLEPLLSCEEASHKRALRQPIEAMINAILSLASEPKGRKGLCVQRGDDDCTVSTLVRLARGGHVSAIDLLCCALAGDEDQHSVSIDRVLAVGLEETKSSFDGDVTYTVSALDVLLDILADPAHSFFVRRSVLGLLAAVASSPTHRHLLNQRRVFDLVVETLAGDVRCRQQMILAKQPRTALQEQATHDIMRLVLVILWGIGSMDPPEDDPLWVGNKTGFAQLLQLTHSRSTQLVFVLAATLANFSQRPRHAHALLTDPRSVSCATALTKSADRRTQLCAVVLLRGLATSKDQFCRLSSLSMQSCVLKAAFSDEASPQLQTFAVSALPEVFTVHDGQPVSQFSAEAVPMLVQSLKLRNVAQLKFAVTSLWLLASNERNRKAIEDLRATNVVVAWIASVAVADAQLRNVTTVQGDDAPIEGASQIESLKELGIDELLELQEALLTLLWVLQYEDSSRTVLMMNPAGLRSLIDLLRYSSPEYACVRVLVINTLWIAGRLFDNRTAIIGIGVLDELLPICYDEHQPIFLRLAAARYYRCMQLDEDLNRHGTCAVYMEKLRDLPRTKAEIAAMLALACTDSVEAQVHGLSVIAALSISPPNKRAVAQIGGVDVLLRLLRGGTADEEVLVLTLHCMLNLSALKSNMVHIMRGGLSAVLRLAREEVGSREQALAVGILQNCRRHKDNRTHMYRAELRHKAKDTRRLHASIFDSVYEQNVRRPWGAAMPPAPDELLATVSVAPMPASLEPDDMPSVALQRTMGREDGDPNDPRQKYRDWEGTLNSRKVKSQFMVTKSKSTTSIAEQREPIPPASNLPLLRVQLSKRLNTTWSEKQLQRPRTSGAASGGSMTFDTSMMMNSLANGDSLTMGGGEDDAPAGCTRHGGEHVACHVTGNDEHTRWNPRIGHVDPRPRRDSALKRLETLRVNGAATAKEEHAVTLEQPHIKMIFRDLLVEQEGKPVLDPGMPMLHRWEHHPGAQFCEDLFGHHELPDGRHVHFYHRTGPYEEPLSFCPEEPPEPIGFGNVPQGHAYAIPELPTPAPCVFSPVPPCPPKPSDGHKLPVSDHECGDGSKCKLFGVLKIKDPVRLSVELLQAKHVTLPATEEMQCAKCNEKAATNTCLHTDHPGYATCETCSCEQHTAVPLGDGHDAQPLPPHVTAHCHNCGDAATLRCMNVGCQLPTCDNCSCLSLLDPTECDECGVAAASVICAHSWCSGTPLCEDCYAAEHRRTSEQIVDVATWDPRTSTMVWKVRVKETESHDIVTSEKVMTRGFNLDWERIVRKTTFTAAMESGGHDLVRLKTAMHELYPTICNIFNYYACLSAGAFEILEEDFAHFVATCRLGLGEVAKLDVFDSCIDVGVSEEELDELPPEADANPSRALVRFEFMEALVRCALALFLGNNPPGPVTLAALATEAAAEAALEAAGDGEEIEEVAPVEPDAPPPHLHGALNKLMTAFVVPFVGSAALHNPDEYRMERLYLPDVEQLLLMHGQYLKVLFTRYSPKSDNGKKATEMDVGQWRELLRDAGLLQENLLAELPATLAFVWARMRVVDELRTRLKHSVLTFTDFLEALCRVADFLPLPSEEEMESAGAPDLLSFFRVREATPEQATVALAPSPSALPAADDPVAARLTRVLAVLYTNVAREGLTGGGSLSPTEPRFAKQMSKGLAALAQAAEEAAAAKEAAEAEAAAAASLSS